MKFVMRFEKCIKISYYNNSTYLYRGAARAIFNRSDFTAKFSFFGENPRRVESL